MSRTKRQMTVAEHVYREVGMGRALLVLTFIAAWGIFTEEEGRPPETVPEYSAWWKESPAKGYRDQRFFRQAFPELETPTELWHQIREAVDVGKVASDPQLVALRVGALALP